MKRYEISIGFGSTGFGITEETNAIGKATRLANEYNKITNRVEVFDNLEQARQDIRRGICRRKLRQTREGSQARSI